MWKDAVLIVSALLLLVASNLNLCCRVSVDGNELDGLYSPVTVESGEQTAHAAAAEILRYGGVAPALEYSYTLSLRAPGGSSGEVADALLRATDGVAAVSGVYVDGVRLGTVEDEAQLRERLDSFIFMQQPTKAVRSMLNGQLLITPFYSRSGEQVDCGDMVLLITGKAHVMYMDDSGKFV